VKDLKIVDIETIVFKYKSKVSSDIAGHAHPSEEHEAYQTLTRIVTDEGLTDSVSVETEK